MKFIKLKNNKTIIVDDCDYDLVKKYTWYLNKTNRSEYAQAHNPENQKKIKIHRLILGLKNPKHIVDHINCNGLDNRRSNLRIVTHSQNAMNRRSYIGSSSKYKGVIWCNYNKSWKSVIRFKGKVKMKLFASEIEAARHYDKLAKLTFGNYARVNFP